MNNKQRLFEIFSKTDKTFKIKLNEDQSFDRGASSFGGVLPAEFRTKNMYSKEDVDLILTALGKKIDEYANYRIFDLKHFLGINIDE
jgi:hypothetical protein